MRVSSVRASHKLSNIVIKTYVLLGSCSEATFVKEKSTIITVKTLNVLVTDISSIIEVLQVSKTFDFG